VKSVISEVRALRALVPGWLVLGGKGWAAGPSSFETLAFAMLRKMTGIGCLKILHRAITRRPPSFCGAALSADRGSITTIGLWILRSSRASRAP